MAHPAVYAALGAAFAWAAASIAIAKLLEKGKVTAAAANLFKNGLAAATFFVGALVFGGHWPIGTAWWWLFLSGFLGFAVADTLYFAAFSRCGVQVAATIMLVNVPVATFLANRVGGDEIHAQVLQFGGVVLVGVFLVIADTYFRKREDAIELARPSRTSYVLGILAAMCAALALGASIPIGRFGSDDVGIWPAGFIRLFAGALGALPMAALSGLAAKTTASTEVARMIRPVFAAPGDGSAWGAKAMTGVAFAIAGLIPYHFALRELDSGLAALLFAATPLFTLPLGLFIKQRPGFIGVVGAAVGFYGVFGILWDRGDTARLDRMVPVAETIVLAPLEDARYPSFVEDPLVGSRPGDPEFPGIIAYRPDEDLSELGSIILQAAGPSLLPSTRVLVEGGEDGGEIYVRHSDAPKAARLASGALLFAYQAKIGEELDAIGVRLGFEADGPPPIQLEMLHDDDSPVAHGPVAIVPAPDGSALLLWPDARDKPGPSRLYGRTIFADGSRGAEVVLDPRVSERSLPAGILLPTGETIVVYRDRTETELRDVSVVRRERGGSWSKPVSVHEDGWRMPTNPQESSPVIARSGDEVAVAWFTQIGDEKDKAVRIVFSNDAGKTFGALQTLAVGATLGRVALAGMGDGIFALVHLSAVESIETPTLHPAEIAFIARGARRTEFVTLGDLTKGPKSGRLDLISNGPGRAFAVWTGREGIELRSIEIGTISDDVGASRPLINSE